MAGYSSRRVLARLFLSIDVSRIPSLAFVLDSVRNVNPKSVSWNQKVRSN